MDPELKARLDTLEAKVDAAYNAAEAARKYLFWTGVITVAVIVLPLIGLAFVLPSFMSNYLGQYQSLLNTNASGQPLPGQSTASSEAQLLKQLGL